MRYFLVVVATLIALTSTLIANPTEPNPTRFVPRRLANLPEGLGEVSSCHIRDKIYVVGESKRDAIHTGKTFVYNIADDSWSFAASRPYNGNHHPTVKYGGKMYLFGGLGSLGGVDEAVQTSIQVFNPKTGEWTIEPEPIPFRTGSGCVGQYDEKYVILCGGIDETIEDTVSTCARYNLEDQTWDTNVAPMIRGVNHAGFDVVGRKFYVIGGRIGGNFVDYAQQWIQIYDIDTNTWTGNFDTGVGSALTWQDRLYIFGGETSAQNEPDEALGETNKNTYTLVEAYDPATDEYIRQEDLPVGLHGIDPVNIANVVYILGGGVRAGYSMSSLAFAYLLIPFDIPHDRVFVPNDWYDMFLDRNFVQPPSFPQVGGGDGM